MPELSQRPEQVGDAVAAIGLALVVKGAFLTSSKRSAFTILLKSAPDYTTTGKDEMASAPTIVQPHRWPERDTAVTVADHSPVRAMRRHKVYVNGLAASTRTQKHRPLWVILRPDKDDLVIAQTYRVIHNGDDPSPLVVPQSVHRPERMPTQTREDRFHVG